MKKLLMLVIAAGAGYYGLTQFPQGRELLVTLPGQVVPPQAISLLPEAPVDVSEDASALPPVSKCTTAAGEVIYGEVPQGTVCQKIETVDGALTVVPSRAIIGDGRPGGMGGGDDVPASVDDGPAQ